MQSDSGNRHEPRLAHIRVNYRYAGRNLLSRSFSELSAVAADEKDVGRKLLLASRRGIRRVMFAGGECTLWPPLFRMIRLAQKIGLETGIQSDACRISAPETAEVLRNNGLSGIETVIAGADAATHGMIFDSASFTQTINGLKFCREAGIEVYIVIPVHSGNCGLLAETVAALHEIKPQSITFMLPDPHDFCESGLAVPMSAAAQVLRHTLARLQQNKNHGDCRISYAGLPLCLLPDFGELNSDLDAAQRLEISEVSDNAFADWAFPERLHVEECAGCTHSGECPGPYIAADDRHSVKARPKPISNSIVFVAEKKLNEFDIEHCPILSGETIIDNAGRCILLDGENGTAELYRSFSSDFDESGLRRIVHELGQVYLDMSGEIYHYDFEKELKKLTPHAICRSCPKRGVCPALHQPIQENLFRKAENLFLAELEKISGRVLDVGCGAVRSQGVIGRLLEEKRIEYFAIEPNPPLSLLDFLERHCISANLFASQVEHYEAQPESFDWILLLCSYNHLYDIGAAFRAMHSWLKPGGHMLLLENIAYGVLRRRDVWEKISSIEGPACFEHYHNHTSQEALKNVLAAGFSLVSEIPVSCDTANQWQIIVRKN